jgi:hypothetical protein
MNCFILTGFSREKSEEEKVRIEKAQKMLKCTMKRVAKNYCMFIMGIGAPEYHHMQRGKYAHTHIYHINIYISFIAIESTEFQFFLYLFIIN